MSYCTQQNLIDRFGEVELIQLTDRSNAGVIDSEVLGARMLDSDSVIDSYLQSRYQLPLVTVPASLVRFACDIVRYDLQGSRATEEATTRYKDAMRFLREVSEGKAQLGTDVASTPVATDSGPAFNKQRRTFGRRVFEQMDADR